MQKRLLFLFSLFLAGVPSFAQRIINFQQHSVESRRHVTAKDISYPVATSKASGGTYIRTYSFKDALVNDVVVREDTFSLLHVRDFGTEAEPGVPQLPGYTDFIPVNGNPSLSVESSGYVEYAGYNVLPAQRTANVMDSISDITKDESVYGANEFFPEKVATLQGVQDYRGQKIAVVRVNPIQYNPVTGVIRCHKNIRYSLSNFSGSLPDEKDSLPYTVSKKREKYIIVTNNACLRSIADFARWKDSLGYAVSILSKEKWSNESEVRDSIRKEYWKDTASVDPKFLLIAGGVSIVPSHNIRSLSNYLSGEPHYATDHFFACVGDENDEIEDMARGRIPVSTPEELERILNFIIRKEKNRSFFGKGTHAAFFNSNDGKTEALNCVSFSEDIRDFMMKHQFDIKRVYSTDKKTTPLKYSNTFANNDSVKEELRKPFFEWDGKASDIVSSVSEGCDYILYKGHGDASGMIQLGFTNRSVPLLADSICTPLTFCFSCLGGQFSYIQAYWEQGTDNNCFATRMLSLGKSPALIASSGACYAPYLEPFGESVFSCMFRDSLLSPQLGAWGYSQLYEFNSIPTPKIGDMMGFGFEKMLRNYGMSKPAVEEQTHYHVFGDPSFDFPVEAPVDLRAVEISRGMDSIYIDAKGVSDISVIFMKTNESGECASYNRVYLLDSHVVLPDSIDYNKVIIQKGNSSPVIYEHGINDVYLQNKTIKNEEENISGEIVHIGSDVFPQIETGDVFVEEGAGLNVKASKKVVIKNGFHCKKGGMLRINK